jgi:SAM-dependent methyltransferase
MNPSGGNFYNAEFFRSQVEGSMASARIVVPIVLEVLQSLAIRSVVDFGCGTGVWLLEFQRHGVSEVLGVDGDYVAAASLRIPREKFISANLGRETQLPRHYDLAISLEVGEHLPESASEAFVRNLCAASGVVLFSACPPTPGHGTGHINEQMQSYWAAKFSARGFAPSPIIRDRIWRSDGVEWFYRQNIVLYVRQEALARCPLPIATADQLDIYHPDFVNLVMAESVNRHSTAALARILARRMVAGFAKFGRRGPRRG